jgi:hypothetical protein
LTTRNAHQPTVSAPSKPPLAIYEWRRPGFAPCWPDFSRNAKDGNSVTTRIHHLLDRWLTESPDQPFIHLPDGRSLTFADLGALTATAEAELLALDVGPATASWWWRRTAPSTPR